ncbi:IS1182 family transposase [Bacteroides sp. 224]|uniref:IS1182 family transposase n=1 Tax=Bacteroides sp. 224 TaxID=2302936 RepID=UPI0013D62F01|nr:IS1182 family transposase [Bacteroides sp. 224]NDV64301.1 IS1182 family transposase [Bacteroides sp. 224]
MLPEQGTLLFSNHIDLYDLIIPKENVLRQIKDLIDFSFVREELVNKYCLDNGRMAVDPVRMFKYLLLKTIYDLSDVDVVERSLVDMSFKYFLDMAPEDSVINPSSLTKFRRLRLKDMDLLDLLINKTVTLAIKEGIIKSTTIIIDATHTSSRSNPHSPLEVLKMRSKQLRKSLYEVDESIKELLPCKNEDNDLEHELEYSQTLVDHLKDDEVLTSIPKIKEKLNLLRETLDDIADHYTTSTDTDARIGHKTKDTSFFGFKTHIAMSDERIVTAATVTSGEKADGKELESLVQTSKKNGICVDTIIADTAYSGDNNLKLAKKEHISLISKLNPSVSQGFRKDSDEFYYNKDAGMYVCPAGHMAIRKTKDSRTKEACNPRIAYYFDVQKCKICAHKEGCYKPGAKSKSYKVAIKSDTQTAQLAFQQTEYFRQTYRQRYKIEAKNAELKNVYGYDRAISYGLSAMNMQGAMAIFAANLKRILKLKKNQAQETVND